MRSSDHSGFVLSVEKPDCVTYTVGGASLPLQKDSIGIIALSLKCEQLHACLVQQGHCSCTLSLLCLLGLLHVENSPYFPGVPELMKTPEANCEKFAVYVHPPPSSSC